MANQIFDTATIYKFSVFLKTHAADFEVTPQNILLFNGDADDLEVELHTLDIKVENIPEGVRLNFDSIAQGFKIIFLQRINQYVTAGNTHEPMFILDTKGNILILNENVIICSAADVAFLNEVGNIFSYYRALNVLSDEEFTDHHNQAKEEMVLYSSTKGVIRIRYKTAAPKISDRRYPEVWLDKLLSQLRDKHYKPYFVNAIFVLFKGEPSVSLTEIIENSESIYKVVNRDYELVLKQFDFDKFKDAFLKEKDKYFGSIRDIVHKVYGQLIGIPVSISASVFATYKVENEIFTLGLIATGFLFYVVLYVKIQLNYKHDLEEVKTDFIRDFNIIKNKSGLPEDEINREYIKVLSKIRQVKTTIHLLIGTILFLGTGFLIYLGVQMAASIGITSWLRLIIHLWMF